MNSVNINNKNQPTILSFSPHFPSHCSVFISCWVILRNYPIHPLFLQFRLYKRNGRQGGPIAPCLFCLRAPTTKLCHCKQVLISWSTEGTQSIIWPAEKQSDRLPSSPRQCIAVVQSSDGPWTCSGKPGRGRTVALILSRASRSLSAAVVFVLRQKRLRQIRRLDEPQIRCNSSTKQQNAG